MKKIIISTLLSSLVTIPCACAATSCSSTSVDTSNTSDDKTNIEVETTDDANESTKSSVDNGLSTIMVSFEKKDETQSDVIFSGATKVKALMDKPFGMIAQPIAYHNKYVVSYWINRTTGERIKDTDLVKDLVTAGATTLSVYPYFDGDVILRNCLGLAAIQDSTITIVHHGSEETKPDIWYSTNGLKWDQYVIGSAPITVHSGGVMYFKGSNPNGFSSSETEYTSFSIGGAVNLNGNIMTLIDNGQGTTTTIPDNYCFYRLFQDCSGIVSISSNFLPATALKRHCYAYMFEDCDSLSSFPSVLLSATELSGQNYDGSYCYQGMFMNCIGIKKIPYHLLKATKLAPYCYMGMFYGCNGLTSLDDDVFHSETLAEGCYDSMFANCQNLTTLADRLLSPDPESGKPIPNLTPYCFSNMFANCTNLVDLRDFKLDQTDLDYSGTTSDDDANYCYEEMFYGCTKLTSAPALPATTLSKGCYYRMFYNCETLGNHNSSATEAEPTGAPLLDASTMAESCYEGMFTNCFALNTMPTLNSTTLAKSCYKNMFENCFSTLTKTYDLSSQSLPAKTLAESCYEEMFYNAKKLTGAPTFPHAQGDTMTLATSCCESMYYGCYSLTATPELIATSSAPRCYNGMFEDCYYKDPETNAEYGIKQPGTIHLSSSSLTDSCCVMMFSGCELLKVTRYGSAQTNHVIYLTTNSIANDGAAYGIFQDTYNWRNVGFTGTQGYYAWSN